MQPSSSYHIYTHADGFENLFQAEENYLFFLRRYEHFISCVACALAYCLMSNNIHFFVRIRTEAEIKLSFQDLQGFKIYNKINNKTSKVF